MTRNENRIKAFILLALLTTLVFLFVYPHQLSLVLLVGAFIASFGILFKSGKLVYLGVGINAIIFYIFYINIDPSFVNIAFLISFFGLFYGVSVYINEYLQRDIILFESKIKDDEDWKEYTKKWRRSTIKYLIFVMIVAYYSSLFIWFGSIDFSPYMGGWVPFVSAIVFSLIGLVVVYLLIFKLPKHTDFV